MHLHTETVILDAAILQDADGNTLDAIPTRMLEIGRNFIQETRLLALPPAPGFPPLLFTFCYN